MFNKILVGVDGSPCALDAVRTAASIARSFGSRVVALNVFRCSYSDSADLGLWPVAFNQDSIDQAARQCLESIETNIKRAIEPLEIPICVFQQAGCEAEVDAILDVAENEKSDLIVLGSRGLRGARELLLGSVSSGVLHHAHCPVLIVRGDLAPCGTAPFRSIILASDGSPCAQKAARYAVAIAAKMGASLTVVNGYEELSSTYPPGQGDAVVRASDVELYAKQWLDYVAKPIRLMASDAGIACSYVQQGGKPAEAVLKYAAENHADLIVVGSRGLRGYQRMLLGSVSTRIVHYAGCPVLVVR